VAARVAPRRLRALATAVPLRPRAWRPRPGTKFAALAPVRGAVTLHPGCVQPEFYGEVLRDLVAVLTHQGFEVAVPEQPPCCGALAAHAGDPASGARLAAATRDALAGADASIVPAAGCSAHLRAADPRGGAVEPLVFLARHGLRGKLRAVERRIVHAPPCHLLNVLQESATVEGLLASIPGLRLLPLQEAQICCGAGGASFHEQPELAAAMGARKAAAIASSGAEWVVSGNPGCLMQIEAALRVHSTPVRVLHPVSALREALDAPLPA
jgi:glycolate oxidase iron-sulfur subunit